MSKTSVSQSASQPFSPILKDDKILIQRKLLDNRFKSKENSVGLEVRQVCFSQDDQILIAVQDGSVIHRWDRI